MQQIKERSFTRNSDFIRSSPSSDGCFREHQTLHRRVLLRGLRDIHLRWISMPYPQTALTCWNTLPAEVRSTAIPRLSYLPGRVGLLPISGRVSPTTQPMCASSSLSAFMLQIGRAHV